MTKKSFYSVITDCGSDECKICSDVEDDYPLKWNQVKSTPSNDKIHLDPTTSKNGKLAVCSPALHPEFWHPLIEVAEMSIEKGYKPLNWLDRSNGVTYTKLIAAAQRHLDKVKMGIDVNTDERKLDGTPTINQPLHAACVAYNMLMLCRIWLENSDMDDRLFIDGKLK